MRRMRGALHFARPTIHFGGFVRKIPPRGAFANRLHQSGKSPAPFAGNLGIRPDRRMP